MYVQGRLSSNILPHRIKHFSCLILFWTLLTAVELIISVHNKTLRQFFCPISFQFVFQLVFGKKSAEYSKNNMKFPEIILPWFLFMSAMRMVMYFHLWLLICVNTLFRLRSDLQCTRLFRLDWIIHHGSFFRVSVIVILIVKKNNGSSPINPLSYKHSISQAVSILT